MPIKNNVTRLLDSKNIKYSINESTPEKRSAIETAVILNIDPKLVFKTIVALRPKGGKAILAIIPGPASLNLKALAKALGEKKVILSSHAEAEKITGLQTGGISPLALINKGFQTVIDSSCQNHPEIFISGGQRGLTIKISPANLNPLIKAKIANIANWEN